MYRKYKAAKVRIDGMTFDSKKEYKRWLELCEMEKAGEIEGLQRQVRYDLIPNQKDGCGKVIERKVSYLADFVYRTAAGDEIVEDVKGYKTPEYIIKRKLMLWVKKIRIKEV